MNRKEGSISYSAPDSFMCKDVRKGDILFNQCEGLLFDVSYMFNLTFAKNTLVGVFRTACGR